ncbi:K(+)-transporting ATPase subunit C [Allocoleopsis sp.]|uniref:K(+)-transporting ATPase subunit C n=1 Tax=Allocoleopsis sp. TaxID=3088169 RepID=UPI002FD22B60
MVREFITGVRSTLVLWVLTAILYPLLMLLIGQMVFPYQANGSLIQDAQGKIVGSALIGQPFTSARYFQSRPSTTSYSTADPKDDKSGVIKTGVSGASNLAPSNTAVLLKDNRKPNDPDLIKRIREDADKLKQSGIQPTADLVYTSGSSLDPHISPQAALAQIERVAKARNLNPNQLELLINQNTDSRFLGIFGEPGVNVLKLNLAVDKLKPSS